MENYQTITLVKRENINCSSMTEDEFVKMMFSDILEAEENYNDIYCLDYVSGIINFFYKNLNWVRTRAQKYAEKKWKTEKKRNEYITNEVENARKNFGLNRFYDNISFFDLDVHPESNGISGDCVISINKLTYDTLRRCFNSIKDNYYFNNATGWKLEYECNENNHSVSFRPHINLIMPDDVKAKYNKAKEDLTEDVRRFYENCHYWGD